MKIKRRLSLVLVVLLLNMSCTGTGYQVHPGSINTFDSQTYDVLIGAKATIDTAREQFNNHALPDSLKPAFNALVNAYNVAYPAFTAWHDATQRGLASDLYLAQLNKDMDDLTRALAAFKGGH